MALTDVAARTARGQDKPYKLADEKGLYLLVNPDGAKYWRFRYRYADKEKVLALGVYPEVSLAEARRGRDDARKLLRERVDPSAERKAKKLAIRDAAENTFEKVAREWVEKQSQRWSAGHSAAVLTSLERCVFSDLGSRPLKDITAPEVLAVLRKVEGRNALELLSKVAQRVGATFRFGIATARCTYNPVTDLRGAFRTRRPSNYAALKLTDIPEFFDKLAQYDGEPQTRLGLKLLALTFVRPGELRAAEWKEFDTETAEWRIPADRMKMRAPHIVPLSPQAHAALEELRQLTGHHALLFPGRRDHRRPSSANTFLYALYRMGYHGRATAHGFRALASTVLNEAGFKADVIERQLAHLEGNRVRAAYHRSEYLAERRELMRWWGERIEAWEKGAKVVPFRRNAG